MTVHTLDHQNDHQHHADETDIFGFWIYIMSDCLLFACLFATFIVLHNNTFGGPGMKDILNLPYVFGETLFLLCSSFTYGLAVLSSYREGSRGSIVLWLFVTFLLGLGFVGMELHEFIRLIAEGHGPQTSGFLSAFFTLVGTHGFHVSMGLLWMVILMVQMLMYGNSGKMKRRLTYLALFWAFLDIVWIFVFTIVYLMGAV